MRHALILGIGLLACVGCLDYTDTIDITRIGGCEGFEWDGRVAIHQHYEDILVGYKADIIRLKSNDGRELLIFVGNGEASAFVDQKSIPATSKNAAAGESQPSVN